MALQTQVATLTHTQTQMENKIKEMDTLAREKSSLEKQLGELLPSEQQYQKLSSDFAAKCQMVARLESSEKDMDQRIQNMNGVLAQQNTQLQQIRHDFDLLKKEKDLCEKTLGDTKVKLLNKGRDL